MPFPSKIKTRQNQPMKNLIFWKKWSLSERILCTLSIFALFAALGAYLYAFVLGERAVFEWTSNGELTTVPLQIDSFQHIFFSFIAEVDGYLLNKTFSTSFLQLNYSAANIFIFSLAFAWVLILTAATYLRVHWYGIILFAFAIFLSYCSIDGLAGIQGLMDFENEKKWFIIILLSLGVVTFLFQFFAKGSLLVRFLVIAAVAIGMSFLVNSQLNTLNNPIFFLANHGIVVPIVLTFLFVIFNGHEIPRVLYWLVSRGADGSNSTLKHFAIVSLIFFLHMVYSYFLSIRAISWELIYVPPFVIFVIMTVLGIWGFVGREEHYKKFFEARPVGLLLYIGWALIASSTIMYAISTNNDPLIDIFSDIIIYSNVGFALAFFIYIFTNFSELLEKSLQAYPLLWQPRKVNWSYAGLIAAFVITLFFYRHNFIHYNQAQAGYLNGIGDVFLSEADALKNEGVDENATGNGITSDLTLQEIEERDKKVKDTYQLAKINYQSAIYKIYTNHKAYWGMAGIALRQYYWQEAYSFLRIASERTASPYTYTAVSDLMNRTNNADESYFTLLNGSAAFPKNPQLKNNLIFSSIERFGLKNNDSLARELEKVKKYADSEQTTAALDANWWTLNALTDNYTALDSLELRIKTQDNTGALSNKILYQKRFFDLDKLETNKQETKLNSNTAINFNEKLVQDSVWTTEDLLYVYHYGLLNQRVADEETNRKVDSTVVELIQNREQVLANQEHIPFMLLAKAVNQYKLGDVYSAFITLKYLDTAYGNSTSQYKHLLGLWFLEHRQYDEASLYFNKAYLMGRGLNNLYEAIALSEKVRFQEDKSEALQMWRGWDTTATHLFQATANEMYLILQADANQKINFDSLDEDAKRRYLHYQIPNLVGEEGSKEFAEKLRTMTNQNLKLEVVLDKIEFDLKNNDLQSALLWRNSATQLSAEELEPRTLERFQLIDLELLWKDNKLISAASILDNLKPVRAYEKSKKQFYTALFAEQLGDTTRSRKAIEKAIAGLPFDFEVLEEAIAYYKRNNLKGKAYNVAFQIVETFPYSAKANAIYALEALDAGLDNYAERSKEFLRLNMPNAYEKFLPKYDSLKSQKEREVEEWMKGENI
ncbi:MAG: hypothetical protein COZ18_15195 [Flexibacter sp. CG_4_10_14_3_um_filter_32_15]|nr:MAG: hypothetical protein COZ18_15195 [Flexibacter sp. CG_4_10_14_3_um_filter_32_15]